MCRTALFYLEDYRKALDTFKEGAAIAGRSPVFFQLLVGFGLMLGWLVVLLYVPLPV